MVRNAGKIASRFLSPLVTSPDWERDFNAEVIFPAFLSCISLPWPTLPASAKPRTSTLAIATFAAFLVCVVLLPGAAFSADEEKPQPRIAMTNPLAVESGTTTKLVIRGWKLDQASEVNAPDGVTSKIINKGSATVPNGLDAKTIGDQQVEIELTLPADFSGAELPLSVITPDGETPSYAVLVGGKHPRVADKEGNDGFRTAQAIELPQIIDGQIHADRNVDVFRFTATAGQRLTAEVIARRRGSALDGVLTLYDDGGNIIAANDDAEGVDPLLEVTIGETGEYFLSLQDAHDLSGTGHAYRLIVCAVAN